MAADDALKVPATPGSGSWAEWQRDGLAMQLELVTIPAGAFAMGRADGQPDERPVHEVWLDEVALGIHPVTNREYRRFVEATGRFPPAMFGDPRFELPEQPVVAVTLANN